MLLTDDGEIDARVARFGFAEVDATAIDGLVFQADVGDGQNGRLGNAAAETGSLVQDIVVEPDARLVERYVAGIRTATRQRRGPRREK